MLRILLLAKRTLNNRYSTGREYSDRAEFLLEFKENTRVFPSKYKKLQ